MYKSSGFLQLCAILLILSTLFSSGTAQKVKRSLSLSINHKKNQTGHEETLLLVDKSLPYFPDQWNMNIKHAVLEGNGIETFHVGAEWSALSSLKTFGAPPPKPRDYEYFHGVGYYKFHTTFAKNFEDASSICAKEGGHLAIVNSEAEHRVLSTIFARFPQSSLKSEYAFVGFLKRQEEGDLVTIFGKPLSATGFTRWSDPTQPDNAGGNEDCGSVHINGGLNDCPCDISFPFFCEYDPLLQ